MAGSAVVVNAADLDAARRRPARTPAVASGVLGVVIFVAAEIMFFAGLISAYLIARAGAIGWPPADQPRLPVEVTAVNTAVLLASGVLLFAAARSPVTGRAARRGGRLLGAALALGACFVLVQGVEWARLVRFGLTLTSSTYGSFFYLIVGAHALHAVAALLALSLLTVRGLRGTLTREAFEAAAVFWYFVVGLWPILYALVYLL